MPLFPVFSFRLLQSELFNVEKVTFYCDVRAQLSGLRSSFRPSLPRKQNRRLGSHVSREAALGLSYALAKGKHFTREEFVSMLLTSVNDIDSRFEGSKTSDGTFNIFQKVETPTFVCYSGDFAVNGAQLSGRYRDGEPWGASYAFELSGDGKTLTMISQTDKAEESVYTRTAIPEEVRNAPEVRSALSGALLRIF